jgi:hypothetical protein
LIAGETRRPAEARRARREALLDAAAACAIAPDVPEAWSLLLQALWVNDPDRYTTEHLKDRSHPEGPSIEAHEVMVLRALARPGSGGSFPGGEEASGVERDLALRLFLLLKRAKVTRRSPPSEQERLEVHPAARIERLLDASPLPLEAALLKGRLVLELPSKLDELLGELPRPSGEEGRRLEVQLGRIVDERAPRAAAARAIRLVRSLQALGPEPPPATRAAVYAEGLRDLEALARRDPGLGVVALRAVLEVWADEDGSQRVPDLLVWPWPGRLHLLIEELAGGETRASEEMRDLLRRRLAEK